jgi:hypothetical protein
MAHFSYGSAQTAPSYKGNGRANGLPVGPQGSYLTVGGVIDTADTNNNGFETVPFGTVLSSEAAKGGQFVVGKASASYFIRGILMFDPSTAGNQPFKPLGILKGLPATVIYRGSLIITDFPATHTAALTTPVLGCKVVVENANGVIQFIPSAQAVDAGFTDISAQVKVVGYNKDFGNTGGVTLAVQFY